jgi:hypothetical protein
MIVGCNNNFLELATQPNNKQLGIKSSIIIHDASDLTKGVRLSELNNTEQTGTFRYGQIDVNARQTSFQTANSVIHGTSPMEVKISPDQNFQFSAKGPAQDIQVEKKVIYSEGTIQSQGINKVKMINK